jgi:NAD-dependent SIR2 family protein deacetylase
MYCDKCKAPVKPDIVFFGEGLPRSFFDALEDLHDVDLLIVAGTALAVSPFNVVPSELSREVPKVLFNMENVFETCGIDFDEPQHNKILVKGKCDESILKLAKDCGWNDDFKAVLHKCHKDKIMA